MLMNSPVGHRTGPSWTLNFSLSLLLKSNQEETHFITSRKAIIVTTIRHFGCCQGLYWKTLPGTGDSEFPLQDLTK